MPGPLSAEELRKIDAYWRAATTPGLSFIYVHANRLIKQHDLNMIYAAGPGPGGPGLVANTYLEGTYSEFYPNIPQTAEGMKRLFTQFSFPGGIPSHGDSRLEVAGLGGAEAHRGLKPTPLRAI
ncbi:MAG TPA: hypothetical protein VN893_08450 [Bryobacteraceae bacterium]|nr:hypothetical protein [Bryobacteraceae bacterium]